MRWIALFSLIVHLCSAQFDGIYTIASSWSMWSAWSACAPGGVMIRVRACSTVRGFKCIGRNKEFKSCELGPPANNVDLDHVDDDREMALRQLYQDYDLRPDSAEVPRRPSPRPPPRLVEKPKMVLPPATEELIVAPPGSHIAPVMDAGDTGFRGSWTSSAELTTASNSVSSTRETTETTLLPGKSISVEQSQELSSHEELREDRISEMATIVPSPVNPQKGPLEPMEHSSSDKMTNIEEKQQQEEENIEEKSTHEEGTAEIMTSAPIAPTIKRRYKASYVKHVATTPTSTTPPTTVAVQTTSISDNAREVVDDDDFGIDEEDDEPLPVIVDPVTQKTMPTPSSTTTEEITTTTEPTTTTTQKMTEATTTVELTTKVITTTEIVTDTTERVFTMTTPIAPRSFSITTDEVGTPELVIPRKMGRSKKLKKINGRSRQPLPTVLEMHQVVAPTRLSFIPPSSPPRLMSTIHHSGSVEVSLQEPKKQRKHKKRKNKTPTPTSEDVLTGDTARALTWLIANMTSSVDGEPSPVMDTVQLERIHKKESDDQNSSTSAIHWSNWSLWSECSCGLQRRKRICLPSSRELGQVPITCPSPQYQERKCVSDVCH